MRKRIRSTVDDINVTQMKSALLALCFVFFKFVGTVGKDDAIIAA